MKLSGEEHSSTLRAAGNYVCALGSLQRFAEAKAVLRKTIPVVRRVLGDRDELKLTTMSIYAATLYKDPGAALDDLREAVTTLEETERTARRVMGGAHPLATGIKTALRQVRAILSARQGDVELLREEVAAMTPRGA